MSKLLQLRGGTTSEHASFTGALREVTVDTDKDTLVIHDGSTAGGHALPRTAAEIVALISNDAIDSQHYAAGSIDLEHMSANSVDSDQYVDGSIDLIHMSANSVDSDQYVDASIDTAHIGNLQITTGLIAADAVTGAKIADDAVDSEHIAAGSLDTEHYAAGSVDTAALGADSVTTAKIADSVALGGSPTTTTQSAADNSTKVATTAYADAAIAALADSAPSTLNTLNELAAALGDDANYATTTATAIGTKMPLAGGAFTGAVTTNSTIDGRDVAADGVLATNALPKSGGAMTGAITTNSTFDGRDVATDGTKLDGIEASATADQTAAQIKTHLENGIDSVHYVDGSIDRVHLAADIIDGTKIANDAINSEHYAAGSIDAEHLASDSVTEAKMAANSVDSQAYVDGSIDEAHIGNLQVTGMKLGVDRRNTGATTDIYSGNANDYTLCDADVGIRWYTANAEDMRLTDAGALHVDNDVIAFSTTISDKRLKHDIEPITDALYKVGQLNGVTFTYNKNDKKSAGLIAQDVEKVLPSAVTETELPLQQDDGVAYKTVQYDQTIGLLVEAIKELTDKVEKLENK